MRLVELPKVLELHQMLIATSGGSFGIRDLGALESAVAQPEMTFDGQPLYPVFIDKLTALGFSIAKNHPFVDGNKRVAHAVMEYFCLINGFELVAPIDMAEELMLRLAAGVVSRDELKEWLAIYVKAAV